MIVRFKKLDPRAIVPKKGSPGAAGFDLFALENVTIFHGLSCSEDNEAYTQNTIEVPLGIASEFPQGYGAFIRCRSGLGFKGLMHFAGLIDSDYRGEWKLKLTNLGKHTIEVPYGKAIAQVVFLPCSAEILEVDELEESLRDIKGFGSTDKNWWWK